MQITSDQIRFCEFLQRKNNPSACFGIKRLIKCTLYVSGLLLVTDLHEHPLHDTKYKGSTLLTLASNSTFAI